MLESILEGFLLGLGAAVPIGAINILIMNYALQNYKSAVAIGMGAMSSDIVYLLAIMFGVATFLDNEVWRTLLGVLGSLFLGYMAYSIFKERKKQLNTSSLVVSKKSLIKFYLQGFILTFINPYTIAFWLSIAGYISNQNLDAKFVIVGMLSAIILWITLMPLFVHRAKHRISPKVSFYINNASASILSFFALSLLFSIFVG